MQNIQNYIQGITLNSNGTTSVKPAIVQGYFGLNLVTGIDRVTFVNECNRIAKKLGINVNWLLVLMYKESTLQPTARNVQEGRLIAGGLIQFTKATAKGLGTTLDKILKMGYLQQLKYVEKYYLQFNKKYFTSYANLYLATFWPAALDKPLTYIFESKDLSRAKIARQNSGMDYGKKGYITKADFAKYLYSNLSNEALKLVKPGTNQSTEIDQAKNLLPVVEISAKQTYYTFAAILITLGFVAYNSN